MKTTHAYLYALLLGCLAIVLCGCSTSSSRPGPLPPLSPMQRAAMQTKDVNGDFDTAFAGALSVLQDEGWQIEEVDKDTGVMQASSLKRQDLLGPTGDWRAADESFVEGLQKRVKQTEKKGGIYPWWTRWERLTLHAEPWQKKTVRMRISIVKCGNLPSGAMIGAKNEVIPVPGQEQSAVVEDPSVYKYLFQQIQKAVFVRQALESEK